MVDCSLRFRLVVTSCCNVEVIENPSGFQTPSQYMGGDSLAMASLQRGGTMAFGFFPCLEASMGDLGRVRGRTGGLLGRTFLSGEVEAAYPAGAGLRRSPPWMPLLVVNLRTASSRKHGNPVEEPRQS